MSSVTCVCVCVFSVFQKLVCIHVDNYNFMEIFFFLPLPFLRPHLQLRQIIEEGWRPNVLLLSSFLLFVFLFFSFSLCRLSLSTFSTLLPSIADLLPWPGTTYVLSLGWTQNHCYQGKCIQTSHNDFHLKPVHKHSQMLTDTLSWLRQAGRMLCSSAEAAVT